MLFPKLYKKSSEGKIEEWEILITQKLGAANTTVSYGEKGGKKITKVTTLSVGKNIGKSNETTPYEQAVLEATAKHTKKRKSGYTLDFEFSVGGGEDSIIKGGINPMLAHQYEDHKHKIKFPVYVQPKLDGHRCIALKKDGKVGLWTRKREPITTVPHILSDLQHYMRDLKDGTFLDGELYKHGWTLQRISSAAKKVNADTNNLEFHVYDAGTDGVNVPYTQRETFINDTFCLYIPSDSPVKSVDTVRADSHEQLKRFHDTYVSNNYEGIMIRDLSTPYEHKRSYSLLKMKVMQDAEFDIASVFAGKDNTVIFRVIMPNTFDPHTGEYQGCNVTMSGPKESNQKYLENEDLWIDKKLTVQFQNYTPDGSLLFPVGLRIREDI